MARLLTTAFLLFSLCMPAWAQQVQPLSVSLFAHRGLTECAPENSLAALEAAWKAGLHGSEVDVRSSRDGKLVLIHDATLERTSNGRGEVVKTAFADLKKLRLKNINHELTGQSIPSLEAALSWAKKRSGFRLVLDLKTADPVAVGELVLKHGLQKRVGLFVGGPMQADLIHRIKDLSPKLRVSLSLGWWWQVEGIPAFAVKATRADALFAPEWHFPARGFDDALKAGAEVQVYLWGKKNLAQRMRAAAAMGARVISSDHPLDLLPLVKTRPGVSKETR